MVCLRNICISTLHKGDSDDNNNNNNNNNNNAIVADQDQTIGTNYFRNKILKKYN
jgi:hypothetical protein